MKRMNFNEVKSLRAKLTLYALLSLIATGMIVAVFLMLFRIRFVHFNRNHLFILLTFTLILYTMMFLIISYDTISYLKVIILGIERMKNGDTQTELPVEGEDELAIIANSLNEMRRRISEENEIKRMAEQTKDELITNVAHDLRTPLTSIIGYLDLVRREDLLTEEQQKKYMGIVYDKAKSLENLIEDLFDYTRYEKNKFRMDCTDFSLNQFMTQIVDEFYPALTEKGLVCQETYWKGNLTVCCDGGLLARAVGNLMNNAIKYGADGKRIEVYTKKSGNMAVVQIVNYGRMIGKEDLEKVFDKFFRVESSRSLETGGTGLGLAIAKNIIELHGGTICADSGINGTIFQIELPLVQEES